MAPATSVRFAGDEGSRSPRNHWAKLGAATHRLAQGDLEAAREQLGTLALHDASPAEILARLTREIHARQAGGETSGPVNRPADYLALPHSASLQGFRRLGTPEVTIPRFPRGMPLPAIPGAGNDTDFLLDAATCRAAARGATPRRMHVIISNVTAERAREMLGRLAAQGRGGAMHATAFLPMPGRDVRVADLPTEVIREAMTTPPGVAHIQRIASHGDDILVFLDGAVELDDGFVSRAAFMAEVTDNLVQVLQPAARREQLGTILSQSATDDLRKDPRPYERVQGFNFVIPARLLRRIGPLESRFCAPDLAAREVAYRAHLFGGYFRALAVPALGAPRDETASSADASLFDALCPRPGVRREGRSAERPRVSVYIPAFNAERFIAQAVESVLGQDVPDLEVCIFEDGSSDATLELLERRFGDDPRVVVASGRNGGIGHASNRAVRLTRAPYVAQLDADDVLKPGAIRRLADHLDAHPDVACCYGSAERIDDGGRVVGREYSWPVFSREKMMLTSIVHHLRMFRRSAWERAGGFREDIRNAVDYDMFLKLSETGRLHHVDDILYQRRWHGQNTSHVNVHHQTRNTLRVQQAALERTGLARDWQVAVPDPAQPRTVTYERRENRRCVVFWPDYSRWNPYQKLLYRKVRPTHDVVAGNVDAALSILGEFEFRSMVTFHLHWLNFVFRDATSRGDAENAAREFVRRLRAFKALGGKVIWTIHNTVSHDSAHEDVELRLSEEVAEIADILHFHSESSIAEVAESFAFDRAKAVVSRHGSFIGAYPDFIDREDARRELGLPADADVLLFLGQIRDYKGLDRLVTAFRDLRRRRPRARLVIAGEDKSGILPGHLETLGAEDRAHVHAAARRIDDVEMQVFFRAADLAVLPYRRILTSGSLLLAMSYGVPAVVPDVGMCREVMGDHEAGFLFAPDSGVEGLVDAIAAGLEVKDRGALAAVGRNARARAQNLGWPDFSHVLEAWRTA